MADDDTAITDRLRKLGEERSEELGGETIVLDDSAIMPTEELRQLLDVDGEPIEGDGNPDRR